MAGTQVLQKLRGTDGAAYYSPAGTELTFDTLNVNETADTIYVGKHRYITGDPLKFIKSPAGTLPTVDGATPQSDNAEGAILASTLTDGGNAYPDGSYINVPLTGGTGEGAEADLTVTGGIVTAVTLIEAGEGYSATDALSVDNANLGGAGSGLIYTVDGVATGNATRYYAINIDKYHIAIARNQTLAAAGTKSALVQGTGDGHCVAFYSPQKALNVQSWSIDMTAEELDSTVLGAGQFRTYQRGFLDASGSITLIWERGTSIGQRLLTDIFVQSQQGARVKLYIDDLDDNDAGSSWIEGPITLTSTSAGANNSDLQTADSSFRFTSAPDIYIGGVKVTE